MPDAGEVTRLLSALGQGDVAAADRLLPLVHDELHAIAERQMRGQRRGHTLQATALVNEAYLRLVGGRDVDWESRSHYLNVAARAMRSILVDHARRRNAAKRGGDRGVASLEEAAVLDDAGPPIDFIALDEALKRFAETYPKQVRVVELRFFAGLGVEDTARVLGVSTATVKRDWRLAKAWLKREMDGADAVGDASGGR